MSQRVRPLSDFLRVFTAPTIWFMHLIVVYGAEALICTGTAVSSGSAMVWTVALVSATALIGLGISAAGLNWRRVILSERTDRRRSMFLPAVALTLTLLSLLGVVWTALPTALLPACALPG